MRSSTIDIGSGYYHCKVTLELKNYVKETRGILEQRVDTVVLSRCQRRNTYIRFSRTHWRNPMRVLRGDIEVLGIYIVRTRPTYTRESLRSRRGYKLADNTITRVPSTHNCSNLHSVILIIDPEIPSLYHTLLARFSHSPRVPQAPKIFQSQIPPSSPDIPLHSRTISL